jgi:hypothetical protein
MTKIPIKTRLPIEAWTVAAIVTLFSLLSSVSHMPAPNSATLSVEHARLASSPLFTSAIR